MDVSKIDPLKDFDERLMKFYYDAIRKEVNLNVMWTSHSIRRALSEVVKAYKKRPRRKSDIRFDSSYRRCAYLLKHSPCFTSAVAKYFFNLVGKHQDLIEEAFKSGNLSLCCLGGGPATDAVAVLHIIRYLYEPYWIKFHKTLKIKVTVVDISEEWQETARNVMDQLKYTPAFFGEGEMALSYEFVTADLSEELNKQLQMTIKSADIITMIYFLSAVTGTRGRRTCEVMVERIMLQMKKGAFVFFLDSAVDKHYEILSKASEKRNIMQEIYGPLVEEFHNISIESVKIFIDLYSRHFHRLICMTHMFFCVSSWKKPQIKGTIKFIRRELLDEPPPDWNRNKPSEEESDDLTQKMKRYRSSVYRLLNRTFDPRNGYRRPLSSSRNFGKIDLEARKTDSTHNTDFESFRNSEKIDFRRRRPDFISNTDFERSRNFEKIDINKRKSDLINRNGYGELLQT